MVSHAAPVAGVSRGMFGFRTALAAPAVSDYDDYTEKPNQFQERREAGFAARRAGFSFSCRAAAAQKEAADPPRLGLFGIFAVAPL